MDRDEPARDPQPEALAKFFANTRADLTAVDALEAGLGFRPTWPTWPTREELRIAIATWIERTCQRRGRQAALGRLTPVEDEVIMATPARQAA